MHGVLSSIQANLEEKRKGSSTALIALHAFTGSNYNNTAAFFNKGKMKALKMLLESEDSENYVSMNFNNISRDEQRRRSEDGKVFLTAIRHQGCRKR